MNLCFHKSWSNCQNIDNDLYVCGKTKCAKYKCPGLIYNRYGDRTPITFQSIFYGIINLFKNGG